MWQDYIITITIIAFSYALIPQVYQGFKKKRGYINLQTSGITALGMFTLTYVYLTLNLNFSSLISFINALLWSILFIQKLIYK